MYWSCYFFNDIVVWHLQFASTGNTNCFVIHICVCLRVFQSLITQFLSTNYIIKVILFNENLLHKTGLLLIWINLLNLKTWFSMQEGADRFTVNFFSHQITQVCKMKGKKLGVGIRNNGITLHWWNELLKSCLTHEYWGLIILKKMLIFFNHHFGNPHELLKA